MLTRWFLLLLTATSVFGAPAPAVWEIPAGLSASGLEPALAKVDAASAAVPPELAETISVQRLLLRIHAGAPVAEWREAMGKFATSADTAPVAVGLKALATAWETRARMVELDTALRGYYRKHVEFPAQLANAEIPNTARTDAWGDTWTYSPAAPKGFSGRFAGQRYALSATRHPQVRSVEETRANPSPARTWKLAVKEVAGQRVLEVRTAAGATVATQPGGRVEDATLLYLGDGWALFADLERIFVMAW